MPLIKLAPDEPFSLDATLGCGQVFRWERNHEGVWTGIVGCHLIRIRQEGKTLKWSGAPERLIRDYFSLDIDLEAILETMDQDPFIHAAIGYSRGLRLIRQPPWECTISYICSTNSNIPTIRRRIAALAEKFGTFVECRNSRYYAFPNPPSIACGEDGRLEACKLGYRQPYVLGTSCTVTDVNAWEKNIRRLPYEEARRELMTLQGVGPKAADCILLFAFQKYEAFPVDVWIRRIMQEHYLLDLDTEAPMTNREYDRIRRFAREHFGEYCGWAQEYLYANRIDKKK